MNNVVLAQIFDYVNSKFTLEQISKNLNINMDEILDGLEELVKKEIAPNLAYIKGDETTLSEEQLKRFRQIRIKSIHNKLYQQTCYDDTIERRSEEWFKAIAAVNSYFDENEHLFMAASARQGATLERLEENSNFTRAEIISLIKKAVIENKVKTDVRHMIAQSSNEEEKNKLLLIQQLSDQIEEPIKTDAPKEERKLSKEAEKMCGSYAEYFDPYLNDEDKQEVTKQVSIMRKEDLCSRYDVDYRSDITNEEICAGIYLYLLSQGYSDIRTIKFFPSAYEAISFYQKNHEGSKDVWAFENDPDLFHEN
ncbi:hypothetical protein [Bacteroides sp. ET225]|uniref:Uncharacterized protein n=1 Tax=Candidatus Phocaeicola excrementipullorum TaxID=2838731 RepID=A0A948X1R0_9BACT|nr:hypothetical protein [Bacteroides sp. ET225]MBU3856737.1 hypothetical protein [Candidatus Phocaeicola excrementipullorum]MCR8918621.1 hypothetical protein [Bacteroides sp. ET225]